MWHTIEARGQTALLLVLRVVYGWFFIESGWGKLQNLEQVAGFFESLDLPLPMITAAVIGVTELVGGALLAAGAGTRWAAVALTATMLGAYATAHVDDAFESLTAFTEAAPFTYLLVSLVVLAFGAGRLSFDGWRSQRSS
jgi:putative oxidoreductase